MFKRMDYNSKYTGEDVEKKLDEIGQLSLKVNEIEQNGVGGLRKLKILVIGNSYSNDSFMYLPFILKNYGIDIELGIYYRAGGTLKNHVDEWNSANQPLYNIDTAIQTTWQTTSGKTPKTAVEFKDWDIIVLQQSSEASVKLETFEPYARNLIQLINGARSGKPYKLGWNININRKASGSDYESIAKTILSNIKATIDKEPISIIFPYGTAIFLSRKDATIGNISDGGYGWASDYVHLQEGLPCYIASLANVEALFRVFYPQFSVMGDITRPTQANISAWAVKEQNGSSVGITDVNCFLAQLYAVRAVNNPWMGIGQSSGSESEPDEPSTDVTAISIIGAESVTDSGTYSVTYTPSNTPQTGVTWSIISGSEYAEISSDGVLTAKDGASNSSVTIKATSTHNSSVSATKVVSVTKSQEGGSDEPVTGIYPIHFVDGTINTSGALASYNNFASTDDFIPYMDNVEYSIINESGRTYRIVLFSAEKKYVTRMNDLITESKSVAELYTSLGKTKADAPYFKITMQTPTALGGDKANEYVQAGTFVLMVSGSQDSSNDVTAISINGNDLVTDNASYSIDYTPSYTNQKGVTWSIESGSEYAEIDSNGNVTVKDGANGNSVTIKAVSNYNVGIIATKIVSVTKTSEPDVPTGGVYPINFVNGTINANGVLQSYDNYASTDDFIPFDGGNGYIVNNTGRQIRLALFNSAKTFVKRGDMVSGTELKIADMYAAIGKTATEAPYFKITITTPSKLGADAMNANVANGVISVNL